MKKDGFTLVELLAVVVILAVVALIATPIILNVINDAKKSSIKQSAIGYVDAVEKTILEKKTNTDVDYDGKYTIKKDQITKTTATTATTTRTITMLSIFQSLAFFFVGVYICYSFTSVRSETRTAATVTPP